MMTPRHLAARLTQRAAKSASVAALALGLAATVFAPLSAQAAPLPSEEPAAGKPFDIRLTSLTFHPPSRPGGMLWSDKTIPCFDGQRFFAKATVTYSGYAPDYTGPAKDGPQLTITGRPADGLSNEVFTFTPGIVHAKNTDLEQTWGTGTWYESTPSLVGRDTIWTVTISHPQDQTPEDHVIENVVFPACKG